jgi:hypothetical protein
MMPNSTQTYQYLPHARPTLVSGKHTLTISQTVKNKSNGDIQLESFERSQQIVVRTPRLSIDPELVHGCYPPDGHSGRYADELPYVVINQATLPWQLSALATPKADGPPWLAVLLFDDQDPWPEAKLMAAAELAKCPSGVASARISREEETSTDTVTVITLPMAQFEHLAPTLEDLSWLTHVRRVSVTDKAASSADIPGEDYAVVIGNRACQTGRQYVAHLISLDGLADLLPGSTKPDSDIETIRLISLLSWNFTSAQQDGSFIGLLNKVDPGPMALPVDAPTSVESADIRLVKDAYARGYCALSHQLRNGANTVSWYRGPLLPLRANPLEIGVSTNSSDALLRYDPDLGMFDVGYAAAWQLGRQMALANKEFGSALSRYKTRWLRNVAIDQQQKGQATAPPSTMSPVPNKVTAAMIASSTVKLTFDANRLCDWLRAPVNAEVVEDIDSDKKVIQSWLSRLYLLYGIPLGYLAPEPAMLPEESLRFFRIDRNWLKALLDGTLSIGGDDPVSEKTLRTELIEHAYDRVGEVRKVLMEEDNAEDDPDKSTEVISGFLFRSRIVGAWPGLEARAFSTAGISEPLPLLRMEKLTPDILLCVFDGQIRRAELIEPAEGQGFKLQPGATFRGEVLDAATGAVGLNMQNSAHFAAHLASDSHIFTYHMKDQKA